MQPLPPQSPLDPSTDGRSRAARGQAAPPEEKNTIDFIAYVSRRVKALTENQQHPQVPFLQDFDTDAPIMAKP